MSEKQKSLGLYTQPTSKWRETLIGRTNRGIFVYKQSQVIIYIIPIQNCLKTKPFWMNGNRGKTIPQKRTKKIKTHQADESAQGREPPGPSLRCADSLQTTRARENYGRSSERYQTPERTR